MNVQTLYQIAFVAFLLSFAGLLVTMAFRSVRKRKESYEPDIFFDEDEIEDEELDIPEPVGVTEVREEEDRYYRSKKMGDSLKDIIAEVEGIKESADEDFLQSFWDDNLLYFQSDLNIKKMLLLKVHSNRRVEVEKYTAFTVDSLKEVEDAMNKKESLIKDLIIQNKSYFFTGRVSEAVIFKSLFDESERKRYDKLYVIPLKNNGLLEGVLIFARDVDQSPLKADDLEKLSSP